MQEKVKNTVNNEYDSDSVYNEKYVKAKLKSYNGKINSNFHNNKITTESSPYICLSVVLIDFVFRTGSNYHPHLFAEECKYVVKEENI